MRITDKQHMAAMKRFEKAEVKAAELLIKATEALRELYRSSRAADLTGVRGADDGRLLLAESTEEFGLFLQERIERRTRA